MQKQIEKLNILENFGTYLNIFGHIWTYLDMSGHVWTCMDMSGYVWTPVDPGHMGINTENNKFGTSNAKLTNSSSKKYFLGDK